MKIISVWRDGDKHIVSRDTVDEYYGPGNNTGAIDSVTLEVEDTAADATELARQHAAASDLPLYIQDEHGVPEKIAERE